MFSKVRTAREADEISDFLIRVAAAFGLPTRTMITDGTQPVGVGIGPALEARDVLRILRREKDAPPDLKDRAVTLAGALLEMGGAATEGAGSGLAERILVDGRALQKFMAICEAQGGFREPPVAKLTHVITAPITGRLESIDNRQLARVAKLAGAPRSRAAGLELGAKLGERVEHGQPLLVLHGESRGELAYALAYAKANSAMLRIRPA